MHQRLIASLNPYMEVRRQCVCLPRYYVIILVFYISRQPHNIQPTNYYSLNLHESRQVSPSTCRPACHWRPPQQLRHCKHIHFCPGTATHLPLFSQSLTYFLVRTFYGQCNFQLQPFYHSSEINQENHWTAMMRLFQSTSESRLRE